MRVGVFFLKLSLQEHLQTYRQRHTLWKLHDSMSHNRGVFSTLHKRCHIRFSCICNVLRWPHLCRTRRYGPGSYLLVDADGTHPVWPRPRPACGDSSFPKTKSGFSGAASSTHIRVRRIGVPMNFTYYCILYGSSERASLEVLPWMRLKARQFTGFKYWDRICSTWQAYLR